MLTLILQEATPNSLCKCLPTNLLLNFHWKCSIKKTKLLTYKGISNNELTAMTCVSSSRNFIMRAVSAKFWQKYIQKFQSNFFHTLTCSATFTILESLCQLWNDTQIYETTFICSWSLQPGCKTVCTSMVPIQWFNCVQNNRTSHILYKFWQLWNGLGITSTVITAYNSSQTKMTLLTRCVIICPKLTRVFKRFFT